MDKKKQTAKREIVGAGEGISGSKPLEETLRESERRYTEIFDQSPIAIEFYDPDGRLINVNSACIDLFGVVNSDEISGFKLFEDPNIEVVWIKRTPKSGKINRWRCQHERGPTRKVYS